MPITPVEVSPTERSMMIVPPVGGWNTKDPLSNMDPIYAPDIENFFPNGSAVELRNGYTQWSSGVGAGVVQGLVNYSYQNVNKLIGFPIAPLITDVKLYDCTTQGAATAINKDFATTAPTTGFIYFSQFKNRLFLSTGVAGDTMYYWDGSGDYFEGSETGVGAIANYRGRWYGAQVGSAVVGYGPFDSISDSFEDDIDLSSLFRYGGNVTFIGSVTRAKNFTEDELICFISNLGEVLVFQGDSPSDTTWYLIGHYQIPIPLSIRAFFYIGPDLHIITRQGVISMTAVMAGAKTGSKYETISENIDQTWRDYATDALLNNQYWTGINYPKGNYALVNVPIISGSVSNQFVVNTQYNAWTRFTGQNAFSWALFNDNLYFGGLNGKVMLADNGYKDINPTDGTSTVSRTIKCRHAFNYFGNPTQNKVFTKVQPIMYQSEGMEITCNMDVDFSNTTATATEGPDVSKGTSYQLYNPEIAVTNDSSYYGTAGSFRIDGTVTEKRFRLEATKVTWTEG